MRVYEVREATGVDALTPVERPQPEPGPLQALVRVRAASLNYRDLVMVKGGYGRGMKVPLVPLSDGAGEVVSTGPGVTRVKPGDRVCGIFMQGWIAGGPSDDVAKTAMGGALDGMLAEYVVLHEDGLVHAPAHLSFEEAATLPCAAVTAWNALITEGNLKAGDSILTMGTGGVSIFALQFATMSGARAIATSSSDAKLERVRGMGASDGINYKTNPDWEKPVRSLTGGIGVDHIVEVGGAGTLGRSLKAVRTGGTISLIGVLTGASEVNPIPILMRHIRVQGIYVGSREIFEAMNRAISLHQLKPVVDRVFPFGEAREAYRYLESGAHFGKICISI